MGLHSGVLNVTHVNHNNMRLDPLVAVAAYGMVRKDVLVEVVMSMHHTKR